MLMSQGFLLKKVKSSVKKNTEEQFVDWLEDMGKYGKLPASKITFQQGVKSGPINST